MIESRTSVLFPKHHFLSVTVNMHRMSYLSIWGVHVSFSMLAFIARGLYSENGGNIGELGLLLKYPLALGPD